MFGRIVKNLTYVTFAKIVASLISFGINIIFIRYLGSSGYGTFITVITYVAFFAIMMDMGLPTLLLRTGGENKETLSSKFTETLILKLCLSFVTFFLMYSIGILLQYPDEIRRLCVIAFFSSVFMQFTLTMRRYYYIFEDLLKEAIFIIANAVIHASIILCLVYLKSSLRIFLIAFLFEAIFLTSIVTLSIFSKYRARLVFNTKPKDWLLFLLQGLPFAAIALIGRLLKKIDVILLSKMKNQSDVGLYGAAFKFVDVSLFLPTILSHVLLPVFSNKWAGRSKNELVDLVNKMIKLCITFVLPGALILTFFSWKLIPLLYGNEFAPSSLLLSILSSTLIFMFPNAVMGTVFYAIKKQNIVLYNTLASFIFNASINSFMIYLFGAIGASITAVLTQVLLFVLNFLFVRKHIYTIPYLSLFRFPLLSGAAMALFLYFTKQYPVISVCGSVIIYFGLMILLGSLKAKDIKSFFKLFS